MTTQTSERPFVAQIKTFTALLLWLGAIHLNIFVILVLLSFLPRVWAITSLILWVSLAFVPIQRNSSFGQSLARFICHYAETHFPITVVLEDKSALRDDQAYVLGVEPHSVLPLGLLGLMEPCGHLPFSRSNGLATSTIFYVPVLRHIWSWMTVAPASRTMFEKLLKDGHTVAVIPGGVQECLYMKHGQEVAFLTKRLGFIRMAMKAGAPLIPVFCFGQTDVYSWWIPRGEWHRRLSRAIGVAPLLFWGMWGTMIPYPKPMHVVVGRPIPVDMIANPTNEQVGELLARFIRAMEDLFENHKVAAGYPELKLEII